MSYQQNPSPEGGKEITPIFVNTPDIRAARLMATTVYPYLSSALWAVQLVPTKAVPIAAVSEDWILYYNPVSKPGWTVRHYAAVLVHEIWHLLREHADRARNLNASPFTWNVAADMEINDDLISSPWPSGYSAIMLPDAIVPQNFHLEPGKLAEYYYERLRKATEQALRKAQLPYGNGSATNGQQAPWETETSDLSPIERTLLRRQTAKQIKNAGSGVGTIPAEWQRWAGSFLEPKIDWRRELAQAVRRAIVFTTGAVDYSYSRPARRQVPGVIMPSMRQPLPKIALAVDTSASINDNQLNQALAEIRGILRSVGQRDGIHVLAVDAAVHTTNKVFRARDVKLVGGGGTDMRVAIAECIKLKPDVAIILTDGHTPWPEQPPKTKVIVALLGDGTAPPWAHTVTVAEKLNIEPLDTLLPL